MNEIENNDKTDIMGKYQKSENILNDIQNIIEISQKEAYRAVNTILVQRNWLIGYRIAEEELGGDNCAEYGANVIKKLFKDLTKKYGKGFTKSNLYSFYSFYKAYPEIFQTVSGKSEIQLLCSETDEDIAKYSVLHGNEQLFASKYKLYLLTDEELRAEIETQKAMFYLQQQEKEQNQNDDGEVRKVCVRRSVAA